MSRALRFLREQWMWWLPPLLVAVVLAVTMLWLYKGDASSPFAYPAH